MVKIKFKKNKILQISLLVLALVFIGYGAKRGEMATVLAKAIKLCLECVGIG
ncbi:hypothetical protein J2S72_001442 [Peptoniphilus koenoeneniae]|uniref:Thioredoxin n=1 Tax=Peptoniphilus koenoeneniae TaxID=507751 RepID=A0ABU0AWM1_9FIRM|nr:hypothetical protein HMPREF1253_1311 [Peptoniphilus sp. BV3C26]MDQ0275415.1 hypothetical protein [Peptoniphilus koenoeneniae]